MSRDVIVYKEIHFEKHALFKYRIVEIYKKVYVYREQIQQVFIVHQSLAVLED